MAREKRRTGEKDKRRNREFGKREEKADGFSFEKGCFRPAQICAEHMLAHHAEKCEHAKRLERADARTSGNSGCLGHGSSSFGRSRRRVLLPVYGRNCLSVKRDIP